MVRLQKMSHDAMVDLLAEAVPSGGLSELIKILVDADEAKAVSVLADLNLKKTAEFLTPIEAERPWLKALPVAAKYHSSCGRTEMGHVMQGGPLGARWVTGIRQAIS